MCEKFYGRMVALWGIMSKKFRWDHQYYEKIIGICIALTNAHIDIQPLRHDEHKTYRALLQEYSTLAKEQLDREKLAKEKSRQRSKDRNERLRHI